jgi:mono/diheme cytochrome c family protein
MVDEFHWLWAIEWTFFSLEVGAGYTFLRWGDRLPDHIRLRLLACYAIASWMSLFWINGILSWQLTPGAWLESGDVWDGFFNPSFWPSLLYRTVVAMALAALAAIAVVNTMELGRDERRRLLHRAAHLLAPLALLPPLGVWYLAVIPADSRSWLLGGSIAMTMFVGIAAGASLLIGAYAVLLLRVQRLYVNGATAVLLLALAFGATGAGEFVREGARKPYTVREVLYSSSLTPDEIVEMRRTGSAAVDPWPLRDAGRYPTEQLRLGAKVFRVQCSICHTMSGANALVHLAGTWTDEQLRMNVAQLDRTKPFMPPFAGTPEEVEAIGQLIRWEHAGAPSGWPDTSGDPEVLARIRAWLDEEAAR